MNKQGKNGIEWCDYTWSSLVGCKNNCWYCYGNRLNKRFKWIKEWTEPKFYVDRLMEPYRLKRPSKIFVCSMADLFGNWVKRSWIQAVLGVAKGNPQHTFQFLTKNPKRYLQFSFPKNCWLGITIDYPKFGQERLKYLKRMPNYKFVSFEPLLGDMSGLDLSKIDLVIVGAMSGPNAIVPREKWIESIKHPNIFFKNNIIKIYPELCQNQNSKKVKK